MKISTTVVALLLLSLSACSNVTVTDYKHLEPQLKLEEFFTGDLSAHGVVKDRRAVSSVYSTPASRQAGIKA